VQDNDWLSILILQNFAAVGVATEKETQWNGLSSLFLAVVFAAADVIVVHWVL